MAFPTNPTVGQLHTEYGDTYTWNGNIWMAGFATETFGGEIIISSPFAPTTMTDRSLWYNPANGQLKRAQNSMWNYDRTIGPVGLANYSVTATNATVNEGEQINFTILANNVADGTRLTYTITGIEGDDIAEGASALSGVATVASGSASVIITLLNDTTTEGWQYATLTVAEADVSYTVGISDTSVSPELVISANSTSRGEASNVNQITISVTPINHVSSNTWNYTVTGVDSSDFLFGSNLTGSFTFNQFDNNNPVALMWQIDADGVTEGTETMVFTITETGQTISITITDDSTAPAGPTVTVSVDGVGAPEGRSRIVTVTPTAAAVGTTMGWTLTGDAGFDSTDLDGARSTYGTATSGTLSFPDTNPIAITFNTLADGVSEGGGQENLTFTLANGESVGWYILDR